MDTEKKKYHYSLKWSEEDQEYVGLCDGFPSVSWLDADMHKALAGVEKVVRQIEADMQGDGAIARSANTDIASEYPHIELYQSTLHEVSEPLRVIIDYVMATHERVILKIDGKTSVALVTAEDARCWEDFEDRHDRAVAEKVLADPGEWKSSEDVKKELGL